ncbi:hypothetical protein OAQ99_01480 [Candidatus Kapabacteria bacterium]|nr:hypothetical protein [Candidatus Kapabacteria bacterium]
MLFKSLIVCLLLIISCSESEENEYPLISIYKDILIQREINLDSTKASLKIDSVFRFYKTSEPEFRKKFFMKTQNSKEFLKVIDSVRNLIKTDMDSLSKDNLKGIINQNKF